MAQTFLLDVYLLLAAMAMGSWGLYVLLVVISNLTFVTSRFLILRIAINCFGVVAYALFAFASYNVGAVDGNGDLITASYTTLAFFGVAGAIAMGVFLLDSVMKTVAGEAPTGDTELMEQV